MSDAAEGRPPSSGAELAALETRIDEWIERERKTNAIVEDVTRGEPGERRWYVRLQGEEKDHTTIWFTLGQRTLHYETYVLPAPQRNHAHFYEHLLRRNLGLYGLSFAIGEEDAVFLVGQLANDSIDDAELDRILGSIYAYVEQFFRPAVRIGFMAPDSVNPAA